MTYKQKVVIGDCTLYEGDCMDILPTLDKVDCVITDPPYFGVKGDEWDNQWKNDVEFLAWMDGVVGLLAGAMKANASLYLFASPQMAGRVESVIWKRLNVLCHIVWRKGARGRHTIGWHQKSEKETLRGFLFETERVIFAEQFNSDNFARGEASYIKKCDELRGFLFEPLRAYLASERDRAGWTTRRVAEAYQQKSGSRTVTGMAGHWFEKVQWVLPTAENYSWLREQFAGEYLKREYEDLKREYEDLRRPFTITAGDQWSDIWSFEPVAAYGGKHPCEKPQALLAHMLTASTKPGAVVLDAFNGSGATALACLALGREYIGIEKDPHWFDYTCKRIEQAYAQGQLFAPEARKQEQLSIE